jgi:hypothetical protein
MQRVAVVGVKTLDYFAWSSECAKNEVDCENCRSCQNCYPAKHLSRRHGGTEEAGIGRSGDRRNFRLSKPQPRALPPQHTQPRRVLGAPGCATQALGVNRVSRMNGGWGWWIAKSPELPKIAEIVNLTWARKMVAHAKTQRSRFLTRSLRSGYSK